MLHPQQLTDMVVEPTLRHLGLRSPAAVKLVVGTALAEGVVGDLQYLRQYIGGGQYGPARSIFQMEPPTFRDNLMWLRNRPALDLAVRQLAGVWPPLEDALVTNLAFAVALCRVHYYRRPPALPGPNDLPGLAAYWKQWWNTPAGKGTVDGFLTKAGPWLRKLVVAEH